MVRLVKTLRFYSKTVRKALIIKMQRQKMIKNARNKANKEKTQDKSDSKNEA